MKLEDTTSTPAGNTVAGGSVDSGTAGVTACDPVFGAVPNLGDASQDFAFGAVDFTSADPYPFPGARTRSPAPDRGGPVGAGVESSTLASHPRCSRSAVLAHDSSTPRQEIR
jgi:hypothetical protein